MSEKNITTEQILNAAVAAFNARKYIYTGATTPITVTAAKLQEDGVLALTPPHSLYRKSAIMLSGIAGNEPSSIAQTFTISEQDVVNMTEHAKRSLNTNPKLVGVFYAIARGAGMPESWLPEKPEMKVEAPPPPPRKPPLIAKPSTATSSFHSSTSKPAPAAMPAPAPVAPVREFRLEEVAAGALGVYNRIFMERVRMFDLEGKINKKSEFLSARQHVGFAILKLMPRSECALKDLSQFFKDTREMSHHTSFKEVRDLLRERNPQTLLFVEELSRVLDMSPPQAAYLKSATLDRFDSWPQVHSVAHSQKQVYGGPGMILK